jgi:hypothetical protein
VLVTQKHIPMSHLALPVAHKLIEVLVAPQTPAGVLHKHTVLIPTTGTTGHMTMHGHTMTTTAAKSVHTTTRQPAPMMTDAVGALFTMTARVAPVPALELAVMTPGVRVDSPMSAQAVKVRSAS